MIRDDSSLYLVSSFNLTASLRSLIMTGVILCTARSEGHLRQALLFSMRYRRLPLFCVKLNRNLCPSGHVYVSVPA